MYGLQTVIMIAVMTMAIGSIIAFMYTSVQKDRVIEQLKSVIKTDFGTIDGLGKTIQVYKSVASIDESMRPSIQVRRFDPTTQGYNDTTVFDNLQTAFVFIKQNHVWDLEVTLIQDRRAQVALKIEART